MTRDDIIRMAREAGIQEYLMRVYRAEEGIKHFAALVAAAEREECAKVCDELAEKDKLSNYYRVAARAIRERGQA